MIRVHYVEQLTLKKMNFYIAILKKKMMMKHYTIPMKMKIQLSTI
mgnify:CR=1 FL=1